MLSGTRKVQRRSLRLKTAAQVLPLCLFAISTLAEDRISGDQILARLDHIRQPNHSFGVNFTATEFRQGKKEREATFRMYARRTDTGFDSLIVCRSPIADINKLVLARRDKIWFYDPKSARPVPVSPYQFRNHSLVFDALNDRLASTYTAEVLGSEVVTDIARTEKKALAISLVPRGQKSGLRTKYWLDRESLFPIKSQAATSNGNILRTVYYSDAKNVLDEMRPTRIVVVNPVEGSISEVKFSGFAFYDAPDSFFDEQLMPKTLGLLPGL